MLCEGRTPEEINTSALLPTWCVEVDAAGWMSLNLVSDSVADNLFVSSALCHGVSTPEEINRRYLNPSGRQLATDAEGRLVIESLPESPAD